MSAAVYLFIRLQRPAVCWYAFILIKRVKIASGGLCCKSASEANKTIKASKAITGNQGKQAKHAK
jgi:uncharacterized membrane-anchored protein